VGRKGKKGGREKGELRKRSKGEGVEPPPSLSPLN